MDDAGIGVAIASRQRRRHTAPNLLGYGLVVRPPVMRRSKSIGDHPITDLAFAHFG